MIINVTFVNGLKQNPPDYDFSLTPTIIISKPPLGVKIIDRSISFAVALEWGYWAIAIWFVFIKKNKNNGT